MQETAPFSLLFLCVNPIFYGAPLAWYVLSETAFYSVPEKCECAFFPTIDPDFSFFFPSNLSQSSAFLYSLLLGRREGEWQELERTFFLPISLSNLSLREEGENIYGAFCGCVCLSAPPPPTPSHACEPSPRSVGGRFSHSPRRILLLPLLSALPPPFLRAAAYFRSFPPERKSPTFLRKLHKYVKFRSGFW